MDALSRFCCLNPTCPDHGRRVAKNLTVTARQGPLKAKRMLRCRTCEARFSELKGTPLFDARPPLIRSSRSWSMSPRDAASASPADLAR